MKKLAAILFFIYVINVRLDIKSVQYDGSLLAYNQHLDQQKRVFI